MSRKPRKKNIWKTIKLGIFETPDAVMTALQEAHCEIRRPSNNDDTINSMLWMVDYTKSRYCQPQGHECLIDLVKISVADLGFRQSRFVSLAHIHDAALDIGYKLCPAEVGPLLRLQYKDQPKEEVLTIGMSVFIVRERSTWGNNRLIDSCGIFYMGRYRNGRRWLDINSWHQTNRVMDSVWPVNSQFVFALGAQRFAKK
jgi:hypothetical protein